MNFTTEFKKYAKLYLENVSAPQSMPVKQGDQVVFIKKWESLPHFESLKNTSTGERIRQMATQTDDPLICTAIRAERPNGYGAMGTAENSMAIDENTYYATVSQNYALGLYNNIVDVPVTALQRVDNGINLPPLSKGQNKEYRQTTGEEPTLANNGLDDPRKQTHASWKDQGGKLPS